MISNNITVCGYMLLVELAVPEEKIGSIYVPDQTREGMRYNEAVGKVIAVGPDAYKGFLPNGQPRFPNGPWCSVGDWVFYPVYQCHHVTGKDGKFYTLLADDRVLAVLQGPDVIRPGHTNSKI